MTQDLVQDQPTPLALETRMRHGLRRLAKAVVIITAQHDDRRHAMAATAVSELSMAPPSLLICVNQTASIFPVLRAGSHFCVNILTAAQHKIAEACSGAVKGSARFELGEWSETTLGAPRLLDAQASFACHNVSCTMHGTHGVFIGDVVSAHVHGDVDPLVYVDGRYAQIGAAI